MVASQRWRHRRGAQEVWGGCR